MLKRQIPRIINVLALVHKGSAVVSGAEAAKAEQALGINRFGGEATKYFSVLVPEQDSHARNSDTGAGVATVLVMDIEISHHSRKWALLDHLLKATQELGGDGSGMVALTHRKRSFAHGRLPCGIIGQLKKLFGQ